MPRFSYCGDQHHITSCPAGQRAVAVGKSADNANMHTFTGQKGPYTCLTCEEMPAGMELQPDQKVYQGANFGEINKCPDGYAITAACFAGSSSGSDCKCSPTGGGECNGSKGYGSYLECTAFSNPTRMATNDSLLTKSTAWEQASVYNKNSSVTKTGVMGVEKRAGVYDANGKNIPGVTAESDMLFGGNADSAAACTDPENTILRAVCASGNNTGDCYNNNKDFTPKTFGGATHIWAACAELNKAPPPHGPNEDEDPPSSDDNSSMMYIIGFLVLILAGAMLYIVKSRRHQR